MILAGILPPAPWPSASSQRPPTG